MRNPGSRTKTRYPPWLQPMDLWLRHPKLRLKLWTTSLPVFEDLNSIPPAPTYSFGEEVCSIQITPDVVKGKLESLKPNKSAGHDDVICNHWEEGYRYLQTLRRGVTLFATTEKRGVVICNRWDEGCRYLQPLGRRVTLFATTEKTLFATTEKRGDVICNRWEERWRYLQPMRRGVTLFATAEKRIYICC